MSNLFEREWLTSDDDVIDKDDVEVNFSADDMSASRPVAGALQRVELPGLWMHLRQSQHNTHVYCKLQHAQVVTLFASLNIK